MYICPFGSWKKHVAAEILVPGQARLVVDHDLSCGTLWARDVDVHLLVESESVAENRTKEEC